MVALREPTRTVLAVLPLLPVGGRAMGEEGRGDEGVGVVLPDLWNNTAPSEAQTTMTTATTAEPDSSSPRRPLAFPWALWALLLLLAAWGGWFIYRTSFNLDGRRFFCLFDDAMISMSYARNLVYGHRSEER